MFRLILMAALAGAVAGAHAKNISTQNVSILAYCKEYYNADPEAYEKEAAICITHAGGMCHAMGGLVSYLKPEESESGHVEMTCSWVEKKNDQNGATSP